MGFGLLLLLLIVAVLIYTSGNIGGFLGNRSGKDPIQLIQERYAKGEIDEEEFIRLKKKLSE